MENTKTNSKSKRSIALLLTLCMLTSFCSYTIAKYMTIGEGNDFSRVAKWGITFDKGSSEMFATTYNTGVDGKGTKVVAPGTSGSGTYILEGTPETAYEITFNTEGTSEVFLGKGDWKYVDTEGYSDLMNYNNTDGEVYYPIKYTVTLADTVGTVAPVVATEDFLAKNVPTVFNNFAEAAKVINNTKVTFNPNTECDAKITIDWAWAFEKGTTVGVDDHIIDAADTILGDLVAKNPDLTNVATAQEGTDYNVNISYKFSLTAKQITIEPDILSKNFKNMIPNNVTELVFDNYSNHTDLGVSTASTFSIEPETLNNELDGNNEDDENVEDTENSIQLIEEEPVVIDNAVDEDGSGDIQLFIDNNTAYILNMNNRVIYAPEDSSDLFSNMTNITSMNLETLDTSKVTNMDNMFAGCTNVETIFVEDVWNISKVKSSTNMFNGASKLRNYTIETLDSKKANVTETGYLDLFTTFVSNNTLLRTFKDKFTTKITILTLDTYNNQLDKVSGLTGIPVDEKETGTIQLFEDATNGIGYVLSMNNKTIYAPQDSSNLFAGYDHQILNSRIFETLETINFNNFDTSNVTNMSMMFVYCYNLTTLDVSNFDTSNVTDMKIMFEDCSSLIELDLSNFDTSNVTDMERMFSNCSNLTSLNLSNFDTSNVTNMSGMFNGCSNLTSLDISNFNTSNVTNMDGMFHGCSNLISLDLSSFDTSNVRYMNSMFLLSPSEPNNNLTTIYTSENWNTDKVENSTNMFYSCYNLIGGNGTTFDTIYNNLYKEYIALEYDDYDAYYLATEKASSTIYARIDTPETPGYFTLKTN